MPVVFTVLALAAIVWIAICVHRASLAFCCSLLLVASYVLGYEFWHADAGPLPITLDRLILGGILGSFAIQWRLGRLTLRPLSCCDFLLLTTVAFFIVSALISGQAEFSEGATSKWGRLATSLVFPALLYFILRQAPLCRDDWSRLLTLLVVLGCYLSITAFFEIAGLWSLVFPRHIADPNVGIHFGRARGPELNAASLGLQLTACLWCAWILLQNVSRRWQQLVVALSMPLIVLGVFFTYTRSTWLGLAASGLIVAAMQIPRRWRLPTLAAAALIGLVAATLLWGQLIGLKREGSAAEAEHSVDQRTSFAYVSWQMFLDHPIFGVGFGRFYDQKLPYLSDRSQNFELESIRPLHHHNTLLSLLTETGLVGLGLFFSVLTMWAWYALRLASNVNLTKWQRGHGVLMLALVTSYLCSAMFHDLTLLVSPHWLLFAFAGATINLCTAPAAVTHALPARNRLKSFAWPAVEISKPAQVLLPPEKTVALFGMQIARVTMREAVDQVLTWCSESCSPTCRYVVTPNVDHAVLFNRQADVRSAYGDASLVLADGLPIVLASQVLGRKLPERVAGSDLVPALFEQSGKVLRVFLLGAAPGVAEQAAARIERQWQKVRIVGTYSPPVGFEDDNLENARILALIAAARPDLLIVGLGAPKQELWVHRHRNQLRAKVAICAGATIDFLAGNRQRSPLWMRRAGLEWLHRVWSEPRRLAARYARDAIIFPQLIWREWRRSAS
jgi:exopolysaccharide biosynthesis WecB/TagA/CpsF family protein